MVAVTVTKIICGTIIIVAVLFVLLTIWLTRP